MKTDFAIVTAVTPDYVSKLKMCMSSWLIKPQFQNKPVYIFFHGFKDFEKECSWISEKFPLIKAFNWSMDKAENQRELMLSSFVLGAAKVVTEPYFVKIDADTYFTDTQDVFLPEDFEADLCAHPWGYTKPGWWVEKLKCWSTKSEYTGTTTATEKAFNPRIISWCCLHKTEFVKRAAIAAGDRLPVPSHDTYLWFVANIFEDCKWKTVNMHKRGVHHCSKEKKICEDLCGNYRNQQIDYLSENLLNNIQIEVTSACNRNCFNCDRNCSNLQAKNSEYMTVEQLRRFEIEVHASMNHKFKRVDIIGGEPMLHKDIKCICKLVDSVGEKIRLTTNGDFPTDMLPSRVQVRNSSKEEKGQAQFTAVNLAPVDFGKTDVQSCSIPWRCGIALTKYGYFPCGAGAAIARVFGIDIGIKRLKDATPEALWQQMRQLCPLCGHSKSLCKTAECGVQETSITWENAFAMYKLNKPTLSEY
jgi:hypothetical protein